MSEAGLGRDDSLMKSGPMEQRPERSVFVRQCAFCGGVMDRSEPEVTASLASRQSGAISFTGHAACFRRALHPDAAQSFDVADVADELP